MLGAHTKIKFATQNYSFCIIIGGVKLSIIFNLRLQNATKTTFEGLSTSNRGFV